MPKVAIMKLMSSKNMLQPHADEELDKSFELEAIHEYMKDTGFSVYSDPKFLYLIGKICAKSSVYLELSL